jgi:hypothetical protein
MLGNFNAEVGREDIFKPTIGNEGFNGISIDNSVRVVNFATSKIKFSKVECSRITTFITTLGLLLMRKYTTRSITS